MKSIIFRLVLALEIGIFAFASYADTPQQSQTVDSAMAAFDNNLKATLAKQIFDNLGKESPFLRGYVMAQFHYQDGNILDAHVVYLDGVKDLGKKMVEQLTQAKAPPPIPEIAGKPVRFLLGLCFHMDPEICQRDQKHAYHDAPPEPPDQPQPQ